MAERFVWPTREHADIVVRGTDPLQQSVQRIAASLANLNIGAAPLVAE